jgi:Animal haem peroxidase
MKKPAMHGGRPIRGLESTAQSTINGQAKFGRMFRWLEPAQNPRDAEERKKLEDALAKLAKQMVPDEFNANIKGKKFPDGHGGFSPDAPITEREPNDENDAVPAGYTYFGQFVDHDITFDPASSIQQTNDPDALVDFRTPRLDLDCIYGSGPADEPYLYSRKSGRKLFILGNMKGPDGNSSPDLNRTSDHTAIIGDKRNDENKIVSQIQALFLGLHNKVYTAIGKHFKDEDNDDRFNEAQRIVRWTYQWIVLNDFLPKVCDRKVYDAIKPSANDHKGPHLSHYTTHGDAYIPVEFAVAAYRFGHSMVRPSYSLNSTVLTTPTAKFEDEHGHMHNFGRVPIFVRKSKANTDAMNGFGEPLPDFWGIDWGFFFGELGKHPNKKPQVPQPSYRIDTKLVNPLGNLPEFAAMNVKQPFESLAFRNLVRGASMGLPSGQRIARMMGLKESEILTDAELWHKRCDGDTVEDWGEGKGILEDNRMWFQESAPLWFYILKEAEMKGNKGRHLGKVGSTIVAETLFGLAWADHYSYLFQEPQWNPAKEDIGLSANPDMLELTKFV